MASPVRPTYTVLRTAEPPCWSGKWDDGAWRQAPVLEVGHFHPKGSSHRPCTQARMLYDAANLYGLFRVQDRYVTCTHPGYQNHAYKDSCVEFFVGPKQDQGYFNFEMSCGGGLLLYHIRDWTLLNDPSRPDDEFVDYMKVPWEVGSRVAIYHSLPAIVAPEIENELEWLLEFHIPLAVLETYLGPLGNIAGQEWRANFNKCADESSHPHWGTWAPIGGDLNFHQPAQFGVIRFA